MGSRFYLAAVALLAPLLYGATLATQGPPAYVSSNGVPSGACSGERVWLTKTSPSDTYCCINSVWVRCGVGSASPIPNCATNEFVTADGGGLICKSIASVETDPIAIHADKLPLCSAAQALKNNDAGITCTPVVTAEADPLSIHVGATPLCAAGKFLRNNDAGFTCDPLGTPVCAAGQVLQNDDAGLRCTGQVTQSVISSEAYVAFGVAASCPAGQFLTASDAGLGCGAPSEGDPLSIHKALGQVQGQVPAWNGDAGAWSPVTASALVTSCDSTKALTSGTTCSGDLVHIAGNETISGTKTLSAGYLYMTPASGTGSIVTAGARTTAAAGYSMIFRAGTGRAGTEDGDTTAGGTTIVSGGRGGTSSYNKFAGAAGGTTYVMGGEGGDSGPETLSGAGGALYLSGGAAGSNAISGSVNGSSVYIDPGAPYLGTGGSVLIGSVYTPTAIGLYGPVVIGEGGTAISKSLRYSGTIDVANITAATCRDTSITLTGAAVGAECVVGAPAALTANISATCYVSASGTVQLRTCNGTAGDINPASGTWAVRVFNP